MEYSNKVKVGGEPPPDIESTTTGYSDQPNKDKEEEEHLSKIQWPIILQFPSDIEEHPINDHDDNEEESPSSEDATNDQQNDTTSSPSSSNSIRTKSCFDRISLPSAASTSFLRYIHIILCPWSSCQFCCCNPNEDEHWPIRLYRYAHLIMTCLYTFGFLVLGLMYGASFENISLHFVLPMSGVILIAWLLYLLFYLCYKTCCPLSYHDEDIHDIAKFIYIGLLTIPAIIYLVSFCQGVSIKEGSEANFLDITYWAVCIPLIVVACILACILACFGFAMGV